MVDDPRLYYVGFSFVKGIGSVRVSNLLETFGDLTTAWYATPENLEKAGLGPKLIRNIIAVRTQISLDEVGKRLKNLEIKYVTWDDPEYPKRILETNQPPPVLFFRGNLLSDDDWAVAVVGTRKATSYGKQVTTEMTEILAKSGVTIVSGLARGIDTVSHISALNAGGRTIAVLGSGIDQIYPPENSKLVEKIVSNGAIISDYPPGTPPDSANFPPRNRIISALSRAVIVVEAGENSGALITAAFAAEQGREVFSVPGGIYAPQSKGTNRLIQQGARLLVKATDVLEVLNLTQIGEYKNARSTLPSDPTEAKLFTLLTQEPKNVDEIKQQADLPIDQIMATLTLMELKGFVRQVGGMSYIAIRETPSEYLY